MNQRNHRGRAGDKGSGGVFPEAFRGACKTIQVYSAKWEDLIRARCIGSSVSLKAQQGVDLSRSAWKKLSRFLPTLGVTLSSRGHIRFHPLLARSTKSEELKGTIRRRHEERNA